MLPYPPSTKPGAAENSLLRVLGGVLAVVSVILTLLSIVLHQSAIDLILAICVGLFALRILILWLGDKPQSQKPTPLLSYMNPSMHPMQSPPFTQGQPALFTSPYPQSQSLYQMATEQDIQKIVTIPTAAVVPPSPKLPRSIRPQQPSNAPIFPDQPAPPPQALQPRPLSQPTSLRLSPPDDSMPMPSPTPLPKPSREGNWQYDDGEYFPQRQGGNDNGSA